MRYRSAVSLFPLLGILLGAAGVVALLATTLTFVDGRRSPGGAVTAVVQPKWDGAPPYVQAALLECRPDGVTFYAGSAVSPRFFSLERLEREAAIVRELRERGASETGSAWTRDQEWLFFKAVIERDRRLKDSFTLALHLIEVGNLQRDAKAPRMERYPIVLVPPDALDTYDAVATVLEATSRMPLGVEPLLPGWRVQPGDSPGIAPPSDGGQVRDPALLVFPRVSVVAAFGREAGP